MCDIIFCDSIPPALRPPLVLVFPLEKVQETEDDNELGRLFSLSSRNDESDGVLCSEAHMIAELAKARRPRHSHRSKPVAG